MSVFQLGEVASIVRGISFPKEDKRSEPLPGYVACLRTTNVQRTVEWHDLWFVPEGHVKREEQLVRKGDILISTANSYELVGKIAPVTGLLHKATLGAFISLIRPNELVDPKFLYHQLAWGKTQGRIRETASTTTNISNVSTKKLLTLDLFVPDLDKQREIVAEIEKQFSRLDEAVANLQRVKANLKRYKASVLKAAVEGRLVETEASIAQREGRSYETGEQLLQRILEERQANWAGRGKWKVPESPSADTPLPDGWVWSCIDQLAEVGTGATPKRDKAVYWNDGDVPWVTSSVVNGDYVDEASEFVTKLALAETNLTLYPVGTLLIAMYGEGKTRGKCAELRVPATTNQALAALQVTSAVRGYVRQFLELNYEEMRKVASGGVQPNLNLSLVRAVCVPLPPLAEQIRIVAEIDRHLSIVRGVEAEIDANLKRAQALRHSVLNKGLGAFDTDR
ncbi:MAG: restriction endonuclease subunit S [Betaproteobacteria bacterium]